MPLVCFYDALSFLKRLPTQEEISDQDKRIDLLRGYRTKANFLQQRKEDRSDDKNEDRCLTNLQTLYEGMINGRELDGLLPFQEKYIGNSFINVYKEFCKKTTHDAAIHSVKDMYTTGLDLQQKLDKVMNYDKCSQDSAKTQGLASYCRKLFKDQKQFYFWDDSDLGQSCDKLNDQKDSDHQQDECAWLNEHVYGQYHEQQNKVLLQIKDFAHAAAQKQNEKSEKLKNFVEEETKEETAEGGQEKQLIEEACTFCQANQDDPNDKSLLSICDYTNTKMSLKQKKDGLISFLNKGKDQLS